MQNGLHSYRNNSTKAIKTSNPTFTITMKLASPIPMQNESSSNSTTQHNKQTDTVYIHLYIYIYIILKSFLCKCANRLVTILCVFIVASQKYEPTKVFEPLKNNFHPTVLCTQYHPHNSIILSAGLTVSHTMAHNCSLNVLFMYVCVFVCWIFRIHTFIQRIRAYSEPYNVKRIHASIRSLNSIALSLFALVYLYEMYTCLLVWMPFIYFIRWNVSMSVSAIWYQAFANSCSCAIHYFDFVFTFYRLLRYWKRALSAYNIDLSFIDVRVLNHFVCIGGDICSNNTISPVVCGANVLRLKNTHIWNTQIKMKDVFS